MNKIATSVEKSEVIEDPIIAAQRYFNIYRQLHIFEEEKQQAFIKELLELPTIIKQSLAAIPGGVLLLEYINELAQEKGMSVEAVENCAPNSFATPDSNVVTCSANTSNASTQTLVADKGFAQTMAKAIKEAQLEMAKMLSHTKQEVIIKYPENPEDINVMQPNINLKEIMQEQLEVLQQVTKKQIEDLGLVISSSLEKSQEISSKILKETILEMSRAYPEKAPNIANNNNPQQDVSQNFEIIAPKKKKNKNKNKNKEKNADQSIIIDIAQNVEHKKTIESSEPAAEFLDFSSEVSDDIVAEISNEDIINNLDIFNDEIKESENDFDNSDLENSNSENLLAEPDFAQEDVYKRVGTAELSKLESLEEEDIPFLANTPPSLDDDLFDDEPYGVDNKVYEEAIFEEDAPSSIEQDEDDIEKEDTPHISFGEEEDGGDAVEDIINIFDDNSTLDESNEEEANAESVDAIDGPEPIYAEEKKTETIDDGYEWEYVEEDNEDFVAKENAQNPEEKSPESSENEDYEWEYVEEDDAEIEAKEGSEKAEDEDYEWEYVEEEETDGLDDGYEWEYVEEDAPLAKDDNNSWFIF